MNFERDINLHRFRLEVRAFLQAHLPDNLRERIRVGVRSPRSEVADWQRILFENGWAAPYWPKEHGGNGWSIMQRIIFDEECVAIGSPSLDSSAHKLLGPVLNAFGTAQQKSDHVPGILQGTRQWCQGFSEPGSGSDLASLRTRAVREGEEYVVSGQKIWTSYAHAADWIFLLVRTDPAAKKQAGISFLLVDMKTPGITVRPIMSIDGCHHLNETFFDGVRVPVKNLVGEEGDGWKITKFLLSNERASAADLPMLRRFMVKLKELGRRSNWSQSWQKLQTD